MPKQKTHKGLRKRVKVTATGKVKHHRCGGGHLMSSKSSKRRRKIGRPAIMGAVQAALTKIKLGKG